MAEIQLREQIAKLHQGELSLDEFEDWFAQASWNIHKSARLGLQRMVYAVELRLAEHDSGHLPERDLVRELGVLLHAPMVFSLGDSPEIESGSSVSVNQSPSLAFQSVGIGSAVASVSPIPR